jgi:hypothetical protein
MPPPLLPAQAQASPKRQFTVESEAPLFVPRDEAEDTVKRIRLEKRQSNKLLLEIADDIREAAKRHDLHYEALKTEFERVRQKASRLEIANAKLQSQLSDFGRPLANQAMRGGAPWCPPISSWPPGNDFVPRPPGMLGPNLASIAKDADTRDEIAMLRQRLAEAEQRANDADARAEEANVNTSNIAIDELSDGVKEKILLVRASHFFKTRSSNSCTRLSEDPLNKKWHSKRHNLKAMRGCYK